MQTNEAEEAGGAFSCVAGSVCLVTDSYVAGNKAAVHGGGAYLSAANGELVGVTFEGNSVSGGR